MLGNFMIRTRLYAGFGSLVLIAAAIGGFSISQQSQIRDQYEHRARLESVARKVLAVQGASTALTGESEQYKLAPDPAKIVSMQRARETIEESSQHLAEGRGLRGAPQAL